MKMDPKKFKYHSLTGRINQDVMKAAWKAVKSNRGAAGIDKVSIEKYARDLENRLSNLMKRLKARGEYKSPPLKRVYIPKDGSDKLRPLGIPTVDARVAQEVIRQILSPLFEKEFHDDSFGFRPGRSCHQAVLRVQKYIDEGYEYVVDADIKGFFDNLPHEIIMRELRSRIADGNILDIVEEFLRSGVIEDGKRIPTIKGTPQGGVISPLLANIALNVLDKQLAEHNIRFVRYADDFVLLCKSQLQAENALEFAKAVLGTLGLELSPEKTKISKVSMGFQFLGFLMNGKYARMRSKSQKKFERAIVDVTRSSHNLEKEVIVKLNRILRGTVNYYAIPITRMVSYFKKVDGWIRDRIRYMKYKRKWRTDRRHLKNKHIANMGLLSCEALYYAAKAKRRFST